MAVEVLRDLIGTQDTRIVAGDLARDDACREFRGELRRVQQKLMLAERLLEAVACGIASNLIVLSTLAFVGVLATGAVLQGRLAELHQAVEGGQTAQPTIWGLSWWTQALWAVSFMLLFLVPLLQRLGWLGGAWCAATSAWQRLTIGGHGRFGVGRIDYPDGATGLLICIQLTVTGNGPDHLLDDRRRHPAFLHQSTANQVSDEEQFEAYRCLGEHITADLFSPDLLTDSSRWRAGPCQLTLDDWYQAIADGFLPRSRVSVSRPGRLADQIDGDG
jgi:hypothetical protein